jgi:hypothetical protein
VAEELAVAASDELGNLSKSGLPLVAKFQTAAAGFANRSGVLIRRFFLIIILARQLNSRESGLSTI